MSAPADQTPSSFDAMTHTSTSSSNRTSSIIVFRSRIRSASYVFAFGLFSHAIATRSFFSNEMYVRSIVPPGRSPPFERKSFIGGRGRCRDGSRSSGCRGALGRPPFLVEQEVGLHEFPVTACHVSCREHRAQVVDVRVTVGRFPAIRQQVPVDVVRQIDVTDPSRIGTGVAVVAELRETTDSEEPAIRQEEEVVFREPVHQLPFLRDPP